MKKKVAIFLSHPVQYFSPLFQYINENSETVDLTVYYFSNFSIGNFDEKDFSDTFSWDIDLLSGYKYHFLKKAGDIPSVDGFLSCKNYDIFDIIKKEKFHLVINFGWMHLSNLFVYTACITTKTPFAIRSETPYMYENDKKGMKAFFRKKLLTFIFSKAAAFFYIGTQNKKFYESFGIPDKKLFFTPYSVDNERFISSCAAVNTDLIRKNLGISRNKKIILFSGKLIDRKRPELLLEAFTSFTNEAHLIFVGSGPLENKLKAKIKKLKIEDSVTLAGFINQKEIVTYYALADIFVLPSIHETWGLVVNEAMCAGCAIIVSSLVGSGYDLIDQNGYIFEADNLQKLRIALDNTLNNANFDGMKQKSIEIMEKWNFAEITKGIQNMGDTIEI